MDVLIAGLLAAAIMAGIGLGGGVLAVLIGTLVDERRRSR